MKAIVHIGTEKTGTTSIQRYLYQNRKKLKSAGFHFLQSAGKTNNRALPAYCVGDDRFDDFFRIEGIQTESEKQAFREKFLKKFDKEVTSLPKGIHTVVISSEHFHSRLRTLEEVQTAFELLSRYFDEFKIVCYLRDQVSTCTSYYSTAVKSANPDSFSEFLQRCKPDNYYFNYNELLSNWEQCFGLESLDVSLFSKKYFRNGELLDDFTAKLSPQLVGKLNTNIQIENESLTPAGQALARAANIAFPLRTSRPELSKIREDCKKLIYDRFRGVGRQPSFAAQQAIYENFIEVNEALRLKFFPQLDSIFDPPSKSQTQAAVVDDEFLDGLMALIALVRAEGKRVIEAEEYPEIYSNLMGSIDDLSQLPEDEKKIGKEAIISLDDLRLLRSAALMLERRSLDTAKNLLSLAQEIQPSLPGVTRKLEEYNQRVEQPNQCKFAISYAVDSEVLMKPENEGLREKYHEWVFSLEPNIVGSMVNKLLSSCSVNPDGTISDDNENMSMGFTVIKAESAAVAHAIAAKFPFLELGATVEVSEMKGLSPHKG